MFVWKLFKNNSYSIDLMDWREICLMPDCFGMSPAAKHMPEEGEIKSMDLNVIMSPS